MDPDRLGWLKGERTYMARAVEAKVATNDGLGHLGIERLKRHDDFLRIRGEKVRGGSE